MRSVLETVAVAALLIAPALAPAQQWPQDRHDPQLTGRAALRGSGPAAPRPTATIELGGTAGEAMLDDVDGDGAPETITLRGGHVVVTSPSGQPLVDRFSGATHLVAVADLDGDGRKEVVYVDEGERILGVLDVPSGTVRWQHQFPEVVTLAPQYVKIADLNSSISGREVVVFPEHVRTTGDAAGYFFDARGALYANPVVRQWNGAQLHFPQSAIANVDGIGDPEVVVVGRPRLMVYGSDGRLVREHEFIAGEPEGRHYGALFVANVDSDPALEAVVVSDLVPIVLPGRRHAISVFDLAPTIRELWSMITNQGDRLAAVMGGVRDFDGDGAVDLAVNRYDGVTQNLEVYRGAGDPARPGRAQVLTSRADSFAWGAADLDADGAPELYASRTSLETPSLSFNSALEVYRAEAGAGGTRLAPLGDPIADARYARFPVRTSDEELAVGLSDARKGLAVVAIGGTPVFITDSKKGGGAFRLEFRALGPRTTKVVDGARRPGAIRDAFGAYLLVNEGAGEEAGDTLALYRWDATTSKLARVAAVRAAGFSGGSPAVADLDGDGRAELLVRVPGRHIAAFDYDPQAGRFRERWRAPGNTDPIVDNAGARPSDVRIYAMAPDKKDRAVLVARDGRGVAVWSAKFGEVAAGDKPLVVIGQFTGDGPRDLWVSLSRTRSWLLDGRDGSVVWQSDSVFHFGNRVAVRDQNGDGADDLIVVSNDMYGVFSGRDARPIVAPRLVGTLEGDFYATPILAPDGSMLLVGRSTVAKATVAGAPIWHARRASPRVRHEPLVGLAHGRSGGVERVGGNFGANGQFIAYDYATGRVVLALPHVAISDVNTADTDGDGVDEFLFATTDGRIVALSSDTGQEIWSVNVEAFGGAPIVASLTGALDVVVPVGDGTLRVFSK